jgi:hypothetical protein
VSDFALRAVSAVALVMTFVVSTSMLVVMMGESRRIPKFLLAFLQRAAAGQPLSGRRDWLALVVFGVLVAGVLFAEVKTLDLKLRLDESLDIESISELALEAAWIGYLLQRWQPNRERS